MTTRKIKRRAKAQARAARTKDPTFLSGMTGIQYSIEEIIPQLIDSVLCVEDVSEGRERLAQAMTSSFMGKFGGDMVPLEVALETAEHERDVARGSLEMFRAKHAETPQWVRSASVNQNRDTEDQTEVPFARWQRRHQIGASITALLMAGAFVGSYITAYSTLIGTGLPVMLETAAPYVLSGLAPLAGIGLKMFGGVFRTDRGHRRFTVIISGVAVVLVIAWAGLFASIYQGLSPDSATSGLFDEPTTWEKLRGTLFTWTTLATEITLGAVMANRLDAISRIYSPDYWVQNPESETLEQGIKDLLKRVDQLTTQIARLQGKLSAYQNALELQTGIAMLALESRRARIDNSAFI